MSIIKEFQQFAVRGNVIDLAIGVVIGTAFGKIVSSLVGDIISPLLGRLVGGVSFVDWQVSLGRIPGSENDLMLRFGAFLQTIFDFMIIALALFVAIKGLNRLRSLGVAATPADAETVQPTKAVTSAEVPKSPSEGGSSGEGGSPSEGSSPAAEPSVQLLKEIRDLLKAQRTTPE